jgi:hypothetical protein
MRAHDLVMTTERSTDTSTGQVSTTAAEVYETFFVPALFGQFVEPMLDAVGAGDGDRVLDIGAGTGVVARAALNSGIGAVCGSPRVVGSWIGSNSIAARSPACSAEPNAALCSSWLPTGREPNGSWTTQHGTEPFSALRSTSLVLAGRDDDIISNMR